MVYNLDVLIETSDKFRLYIVGDKKPLNCGVEGINKDGTVYISKGALPETRRLLIPFTVFKIVKDNETVFQAKVLKVIDQSVSYVVAGSSDNVAPLQLEIELLCDIEHCLFFEPYTKW